MMRKVAKRMVVEVDEEVVLIEVQNQFRNKMVYYHFVKKTMMMMMV